MFRQGEYRWCWYVAPYKSVSVCVMILRTALNSWFVLYNGKRVLYKVRAHFICCIKVLHFTVPCHPKCYYLIKVSQLYFSGTMCMNNIVWVVTLNTTKIQKKHLSENLETNLHSASILSISYWESLFSVSPLQWQQHPHVKDSSSPGPGIPSVKDIMSDCLRLLQPPFLPWPQGPWRMSISLGGKKFG